VETIGSKRSYALIWCMPNNDDDDGCAVLSGSQYSVIAILVMRLSRSFNLFFEAEPFAAISNAHGTHRHSQKFVLGH